MRNRWISLSLIMCGALLAGCNGARETDSVAYVLAVGVDKAGEDAIRVTYQIAVPAVVDGPEKTGQSGQDTFEIVSFTAPSLAEARSLLNSTVSRIPDLSHMKAWVIGEEMARSGLKDIIGPLQRFREFRGSEFIMVTKGSAENFMRQNDPKLEVLPSKYYEIMLETATQSGYYTRTNLHQFYYRLKSHGGEPFAVLAAINPLTGEGSSIDQLAQGEKAKEYVAGYLPRRGGNPAEFLGLALFSGDKMVGVLTNQEVRMANILMGKFPEGFITVADPLLPTRGINVRLRQEHTPKITINTVDKTIDVNIQLEGEITSIPTGIHYEEKSYRPLLEAQINQVIQQDMEKMLKYTQEVGSDVIGFGIMARPHYRTEQEYVAARWCEIYPQMDIRVRVKVALRWAGLMIRTSPMAE